MIGAWIGMAGPSPPPVPTLGLSLDVGRETANQTQASQGDVGWIGVVKGLVGSWNLST